MDRVKIVKVVKKEETTKEGYGETLKGVFGIFKTTQVFFYKEIPLKCFKIHFKCF